jgi:DNA polymerase
MRCKPKGPTHADILIVGEAPGKDEDILGIPFVGASGQELDRMLNQAGLPPAACRFTNVFQTRPPNNDLGAFCGKRSDVPKDYSLPPLGQGQWVLPEHLSELDRLGGEIEETRPKLVIACGNTPCWALLGRTGVTKLRGTIFHSERYNVPVLPTFHPAAILREWSNRTISVTDYIKARRFVTEGFSVPRRELWLAPTIQEVKSFFARYIYAVRPAILSVDIETFGGTITCIGFSPSPLRAITIPFYDPAQPDRNYWPTKELEREAWMLVKEVLESDIPKLGQNFLYDLQYLWRAGVRVKNATHDTMIRHHSLYPEMPKSLGFLASIYTDEANWKVLRDRNRDNLKADDE